MEHIIDHPTIGQRLDHAIAQLPEVFSDYQVREKMPRGRNNGATPRQMSQKLGIMVRQGALRRVREGVYEKVMV